MNIYEEIVKLQREGRSGAVATIVNSHGSIPSFQSAKMLIRDDGSIAGTIGGGCVEAEVWQAAREVITEGKNRAPSPSTSIRIPSTTPDSSAAAHWKSL